MINKLKLDYISFSLMTNPTFEDLISTFVTIANADNLSHTFCGYGEYNDDTYSVLFVIVANDTVFDQIKIEGELSLIH